MKIVVRVRGTSPDASWKYQDFTYSCIEFDNSWRYTCMGEGNWCTCTTANDITTSLAFVCAGITPDTKKQFLESLEKELNEKFSDNMPTITELKALGYKIRQYLVPSLKNICFTHFMFGPKKREELISSASVDLQNDFAEFKFTSRPNECW